MLDLERIYDVYLDKLQEERNEKYKPYKTWFGGSSAANCYKKQWFTTSDYEPKPFDIRTKRLLRLGTIVHKDFEDAVEQWLSDMKENSPEELKGIEVYKEYEIKIPEFKIIGHLDYCIIEQYGPDDVNISVADLKTLAGYGWTSKFGREAKKKGINVHRTMGGYELQVGTYALGMLKNMGLITDLTSPLVQSQVNELSKKIKLYILWYNKNDSNMKRTEVPSAEALELAIAYWQDLNDFINETSDNDIFDIAPNGAIGVPNQPWGIDKRTGKPKECNYCQYSITCKGG